MATPQVLRQPPTPNTSPSPLRPASASPSVSASAARPTPPTPVSTSTPVEPLLVPTPSPVEPLPVPTSSPVSTTLGPGSSSPDSLLVTQSSIIPQPQTIPIDPDNPNSSLSFPSSKNSNNSHSLPVVAVVIISIIVALVGLIILYRLYRRVSYRFLRRRPSDSSELPFSPPPPPLLDPGFTPSSRFIRSDTASNGSFHPRAGATLARSSLYYPTSNYQASQHLGLLLETTDKADQAASEYFAPGLPRDSLLAGPGSELTSDLSSLTRSPSPLASLNNPLLSTRDHSTLSTDTLKNASRRASNAFTNRQSFFELRNNGTSPPPMPLEQRMSRVGLPHLSKNRLELSLPSPLAPTQGLVKISNHAGKRLEFSPQSGITDLPHVTTTTTTAALTNSGHGAGRVESGHNAEGSQLLGFQFENGATSGNRQDLTYG